MGDGEGGHGGAAGTEWRISDLDEQRDITPYVAGTL